MTLTIVHVFVDAAGFKHKSWVPTSGPMPQPSS